MKKILIGLILLGLSFSANGYDFIYEPNLLTRSSDPFYIKERVMRFDDRIVSYDTEKELYYREYNEENYYCKDGSIVETTEETLAREERENSEQAERIVAIAETAAAFRWVLRQHFGEGAETNTAVTESIVTQYFIQRRILGTGELTDASDAILLQSGFETIKEVTGDGTIWSFPWSQIPEIGATASVLNKTIKLAKNTSSGEISLGLNALVIATLLGGAIRRKKNNEKN